MTTVNPDGNSETLSLEEGIAAYAGTGTDDEAENGQSEAGQDASGEDQPDDLENDGQDVSGEDQADENDQAPAYAALEAKVKLQDGTEVTVDDLIKGNLRDRDYRLKTSEVATERRALAERSEQIQQLEARMADDRAFMEGILTAIMPQRPDPSLYATDPVGWGQANLDYTQRKEQLEAIVNAGKEAAARQQQTVQGEQRAIQQREWDALLTEMPELKDHARLNTFVGKIQKAGADYGFSPQDLRAVALDHRMSLVLRDAGKWRDLQASKTRANAKVQGRPPVQSGTRPAPGTQKAREAKTAMDRLNKTGSLRDGVAALLASQRAKAG